MTLYADLPARRARQIVGDLLVLGWVVLWIRLGSAVHDTVLGALGPARRLESAGQSLEGALGDVAARVAGVPLLGDAVATPFEAAATAGETMRQAGADLVAVVDRTALLAGFATALVPLVLVVLPWLVHRVGFARRAQALAPLLAREDALDLLALRALATQPLGVLTRVSPTPARDWRAGRADVVTRLAALELRAAGVDPERVRRGGDGGVVTARG